MGLFQRVFSRSDEEPARPSPGAASARSQPRAAAVPQDGASSPQTVRKELVRVATRDTLLHHGIPANWFRAEPLTMTARNRDPGVHVRLCLLHWDSRLMEHSVALQQQIRQRIQTLDPASGQWLMGMSWQFDLADASACPAMPPASTWTSGAAGGKAVAPASTDGNADVISGPTRIRSSRAQDARRQLDRMMGERDADFESSAIGDFQQTQAMKF